MIVAHTKAPFVLFFAVALAWMLISPASAQETFTSSVIDASTHEPLPFASIFVDAGHSTITNRDGDFSITVSPQAMLRISYVGYNTINIKAANLKSIVRLKPYSKQLDEVVIKPIDVIGTLKRLVIKLNREYAERQGIRSNYFYRQISQNDTTYNELVEGFFRAKSCIELRDFQLTTGRYGHVESSDTLRPFYMFSNFFTASAIAPFMPYAGNWTKLVTPLPVRWTKKLYKDTYVLQHSVLSGDNNERLLMIKFELPPDKHQPDNNPITAQDRNLNTPSTLVGTLVIDLEKLQLLYFRGQIKKALVKTFYPRRNKTVYTHRDVEYTITYQHNHGFNEIASIGVRMHVKRNNDYENTYWSTMFNIGDYDLGQGSPLKEEKLYKALRKLGNDAQFKENYKIVKTTAVEESIIKRMESNGNFGVFSK